MNILLDAYYDRNFGDDLFVEGIASKYPNHRFYSFLEFYPEEIIAWAQKIPNLYALPQEGLFLEKRLFDAYICVGGDVFPDGGDFESRKRWVESVKKAGGMAAFVGFSLFHEYSEETKKDICQLMEMADVIAPRDTFSADLLRSMLPGKEITPMADLAFSGSFMRPEPRAGLLGISVRRPNYASDEQMRQYIGMLQKATDAYLDLNPSNRVRILGLSGAGASDAETGEMLLREIRESQRAEYVEYNGNLTDYKRLIGECESVICTRLHAMIACLAMKIPFVPVIYEVKAEHLLNEIGFEGKTFSFRNPEGMEEVVRSGDCTKVMWDPEKLSAYLERSEAVFQKLGTYLGETGKEGSIGNACAEKEELCGRSSIDFEKMHKGSSYLELLYGKRQAKLVQEKEQERDSLISDLKSYEETILELNDRVKEITQEVEAEAECNRSQFEMIEELNRKNRELFEQSEALNEKIKEQFRTIEELNQKNGEQFHLIEDLNGKNGEQFRLIEDLNEKNGEQFHLIEELNQKNAEFIHLIEELNAKNVELQKQIEERNEKGWNIFRKK